MPADNGQFGKMAALAPQQRQYEFGSYYPAGTLVETATAPSRWDGGSVGQRSGAQTEDDKRKCRIFTIFVKL